MKCRILIVAVHIAQQAEQLFESGGIEAAVFLQAVLRASAKLIEIPASFGDADYRNVEVCLVSPSPASDGKIFLYARSPVAPKKTSASEWALVMISLL